MNDKNFTQEEANQFIIDCHRDLEAVQRKVAEKPGLANAHNPETDETALGAAAHMGMREIAIFLLDHGAKPELAAAAMLGQRDQVAEWLSQDPGLAASGGSHGIPVAFHAAISGDTAIMQMLWDAGAREPVRASLFGAVAHNRVEMVRWLLARGAGTDLKAPDGSTPLEFAQAKGYLEIAELLQDSSS